MKKQPTEWEKIFANHISDEGIISRIFKGYLQLNDKKTTQFKNKQRIWIDTFSKMMYPWLISIWKDAQPLEKH